eukprot:TRINITY_DN7687_c0_g1_i1.p1 TRINITY_DN7687_c0_g1~~TRINITY_DN7687_c0_g1_i1.p1  ORF type:complete len:345 (-),score=159.05 TRINITY_DN7687_c0_g1_i1:41-1030(-)
MSSSATFKINFSESNEIRRVTLAEPSWANFVAFVTKSNNQQEQETALSKVYVNYLDEDGDKISVSSEAEFTEALVVQAAKSVKAFSVSARDQKRCHRKAFGKGCRRPFSFGMHPLFAAANIFSGQPSRSTTSDSSANNIDVENLTKLAQEFFKNVEIHATKKDEGKEKDNQKKAEGSTNSQQMEFDLKGAFEEFTKAMDSVQSALPQVAGAFSSVMQNSQNQDQKLNFEAVFEPLNDLIKNLFSSPSVGASASSAAQAPENSGSDKQEEAAVAKEAVADQDDEAVKPDQFAEELAILKELGFSDKETNLSLLRSANGEVQTVINSLLDL